MHLFPEKDMQASRCSPYQHPQQPSASVTYALCSSQDKYLLDSLYHSIFFIYFFSKSVLTIVSWDVFESSKWKSTRLKQKESILFYRWLQLWSSLWTVCTVKAKSLNERHCCASYDRRLKQSPLMTDNTGKRTLESRTFHLAWHGEVWMWTSDKQTHSHFSSWWSCCYQCCYIIFKVQRKKSFFLFFPA